MAEAGWTVVVLVHGMGRTPLSMLWLRRGLASRGYRALLFGYSPTFESMAGVSRRLVDLIRRRIGAAPYVLVGHSLGSTIIRHSLPALADRPPAACYFLAPPMVACRAARRLSGTRPYRWLTGEMGQLLADPAYMNALPMPAAPTRIYAGIAGPRARCAPLGDTPNDGILTLAEASSDRAPVVPVAALHTFIMNSGAVCRDMLASLAELGLDPR